MAISDTNAEQQSTASPNTTREARPAPTAQPKGPWLWPLLLVAVGVVWLLQNFLLLGDFNIVALLPLALVVIGLQVLLRGDATPSDASRTFGITRGNIESATLTISAAEIDVEVNALQREGRLIAGQYAPQVRPLLQAQETHALLVLDRAATPGLFLADWQLGIAQNMPWGVYISTHLGQVRADLSQLVVQEALIASGIGDVRVVAPREALGALTVQSAFGDIHITAPPSYCVRVMVQGSRLVQTHVDARRFGTLEPHTYATLDAITQITDEDGNTHTVAVGDGPFPLIDILVRATFGNVYLS
jgi:hypothetical protein